MRSNSRIRLLIASTLALLVLTGCGGGSDSSGSEGSGGSDDSSSSSADSGDSGDEAASELTKDDFGQRVYTAFQEAGTASFRIEQSGGGQSTTGTGEADLSGEEIRSRVEMETPQGTIEAIAVDGLFYLKIPQLPSGKYLRVDPDDESGLGALVGQLGGNSDPSQSIRVFEDATEVTAGAQEEVEGVATTKYRVVLPREAVAESLGADEQVVQLLPEEIAYDVWVDADDLVRKTVSEIEVQGQTSTTTLTYTGFGEPVDVQAPPAGQVTDQLPGMG